MKMTDEEYVGQEGAACPHCRSTNIEGTARIDMLGDEATQEVVCLDCDETWTDIYKLIGYEEDDDEHQDGNS